MFEKYANSSEEVLVTQTDKDVIEKDEEEEEDVSLLPSGVVILDRLKPFKYGTHIVKRDSPNEVLYSITQTNLMSWKGPTTNFVKGTGEDIKPYAILGCKGTGRLQIGDSAESQELVEMKSHTFLFSSGLLKGYNRFVYEGTEYRLNQKMNWHGDYELGLAATPDATPLAIFKMKYISKTTRGRILIQPQAISHGTEQAPHSLLHNGIPTRLLDLTLVAEAIRKHDAQQTAAAVA